MDKDKEEIKELLAVALQYDSANDSAPKISAKGKDLIAEQIIKIAQENGIEIHKDKDLAEILSVLELDSYIPIEAYAAVAEILAYAYKANAEKLGKQD